MTLIYNLLSNFITLDPKLGEIIFHFILLNSVKITFGIKHFWLEIAPQKTVSDCEVLLAEAKGHKLNLDVTIKFCKWCCGIESLSVQLMKYNNMTVQPEALFAGSQI